MIEVLPGHIVTLDGVVLVVTDPQKGVVLPQTLLGVGVARLLDLAVEGQLPARDVESDVPGDLVTVDLRVKGQLAASGVEEDLLADNESLDRLAVVEPSSSHKADGHYEDEGHEQVQAVVLQQFLLRLCLRKHNRLY